VQAVLISVLLTWTLVRALTAGGSLLVKRGQKVEWLWVRRLLFAAYVTATFVYLQAKGTIPSDREIIVAWLACLALVATVGRTRRQAIVTLRSWVPFLFALFLYDFARAIGHWLDRPIAVTPQITADRWLGGGKLWTERLQNWLIDSRVGLRTRPIAEVEQILRNDESTIHWYDVLVSAVYQSHFFVPYLAAGIIWAKGQRLWRWYAATFVSVNFAACAVFALYATAPPWYAAQKGLIEPFPRVLAARGWSQVGLRFAARIIEKGQSTVNPFAAIPSLHSAQALLVAIFLWQVVWKWMRPLLAALPIAMTFALVYSGEHYFIDVLCGWGLVALALTGGWWLRQHYGWKSPWRDGAQLDSLLKPTMAPENPGEVPLLEPV
jgi:membrane-associated phospholipid phosphatase